MSVRFLKWAIARHYRQLGYKVAMRPVHVGNAEIDGAGMPGYTRIPLVT